MILFSYPIFEIADGTPFGDEDRWMFIYARVTAPTWEDRPV